MSRLNSIPSSFRYVDPRLSHALQECRLEIDKAQQSQRYEDLRKMAPHLHNLADELNAIHLGGAGLLALSLSELSHVLSRQTCQISFNEGIEALAAGIKELAEYVLLVSERIMVSPFILLEALNRVQNLFGTEALTRYDLFDLDFTSSTMPDGNQIYADSQAIARTLHLGFRRHLLIFLKEQQLNPLDEWLKQLAQLKQNGAVFSQFACIASSCTEAAMVANGILDRADRIRVLFAEIDIELQKLCASISSDNHIQFPQSLVRKMLFFVGETVQKRSRVEFITLQDVGPSTERVYRLYCLNFWFCDDPIVVVEKECRRAIELAVDLSRLKSKRSYSKSHNLISLYLLGGLDSDKSTQMLAMLQELVEIANQHEDSLFKTYLASLCEAISRINVDSRQFLHAAADLKIAAAWFMAWDFVARPTDNTREKIRCFGQRLHELERIAGQDYCASNDANFMRPWPKSEFLEANNILANRILNDLSKLRKILAEPDSRDSGQARLDEIQSLLGGIECLLMILGFESVMHMVQNAGLSIVQAIQSNVVAEALTEEFAPVLDSIENLAIRAFEKNGERIQDRLNRQNMFKPSAPIGKLEAIRKESNAVGSLLENWQTDFPNPIAINKIRKAFVRLAILCKSSEYEEICRICTAVTPMIGEESIKSLSDATVVLNLLLEVHQGIDAELASQDGEMQGNLAAILRMIEKLSV